MPDFIPIDFDPFAEEHDIQKLTLTNEPQKEIWLACIIGGDDASRAYNESVSLKISGDLNFEAFKRAVNSLVQRHEALRATISPDGETLIIYKDISLRHNFEDLSGLSEAEKKKAFDRFLNEEVNTVLDLKDGPLFKIFLHKTGSEEYYFTIIKHHIIGDGWSTGVMLEDLSKMYNAYAAGGEIVLPPASQISDYAAAQENFKTTKAYKETEDYWLNLYKDDIPVLNLPTDNPRRSPRTYKGNRVDQPLSKEMVDQLKTLGAKAGCSLVTTLLAAFEVFLYRETHQRDIVVGLPASGQAATGLTDVVGHCVNLLPLRTRIAPASYFNDYLKKRKREVLDAYDHQRITFGELIKNLYIPRDPARITLVPVMFNIDMGMDNAVFFEGLDYQLISNPRAYENFEIYMNATGSKDGMILEWSYNTALFEAETIHAFNAQYLSILDKIIEGPATIADLTGHEENTIAPAAAAQVAIPSGETINTLFEQIVDEVPYKTAVSFRDVSLTYRQLNQKINQVAAFLLQNGISHGDIVALSIDRSVEMLVCLLAVLKTGAVYLPLDPDYPQERIVFMLQDSSAKLLITSKKYNNKYKGSSKQISIDEIWPKLTDAAKQLPQKEITGNDLAYLLYTSGSTGNPKGVKVTHRNLANFLTSMKAIPGIAADDRLLAITSISFDIAGLELYLPLITGAELVLADTEATRDGRLLLDIIERKNISIMQATPSTWQMMQDSGWEKRYPLKILSGGEALPKDLADKLLAKGNELWNMYGPTETTIWSTIKQILPGEAQVTIGTPINNTQVYIMDEYGRPLPAGQTGEIYIGGEGVAAGYYNRAGLTAEKFVADPYAKGTAARLYRTGDLGKILNNGEIQYLGRIDHQVKIRGHRIELGEIETKVLETGSVKQCVVLAREDTPGDKRLVAYVTLNDNPDNTDNPGWKERWDTLYEIGAEDKQNTAGDHNIDGTLLEHLSNKDELTKQAAEWLQTSIDRIKKIGAKRIYEIGSGAGQIMFGLAPDAEFYQATDYAQAAINNIKERLAAEPGKWQHVKAGVAAADDFSAISNTPVDLVLINSVAQYFPNAGYLINVVRQAAGALSQGGCIFIGDMQGKNTLEMYHAMDYLPRASELSTVASFKEVVANRVRIEEELVADPAFFYLLPKLIPNITAVDVQLRKGQSLNETTKYHYDVWLYIDKPVETVAVQQVLDWKEVETIAQLELVLNSGRDAIIAVKNIPNARTAQDYKLLQLLNQAEPANIISGIKSQVSQSTSGIRPDLFWSLGDKLEYDTHIRWATDGADGLFEVVFIPAGQPLQVPAYPAELQSGNIYDFARTPVSGNEMQAGNELAEAVKEKLSATLPAYMVPEDVVILKSFPLTPNAKIDRRALPKPQPKKEIDKTNIQPLTENEQLVADIWSEILGLNDLNPTDDFFQLGGHSLLAVKVMVALEKKTGKRLNIATLFEHPTIEKLARQLSDGDTIKDWNVLTPLKDTGKKVPIFFVHGADLHVLLFKTISDYMDADQPVYGLQALGLNHEMDIPVSIEQMAALYVADMLKAHPAGPYAIAGYSLGGFIAFEIARQLQLLGKEVAFLGIIDTYAGKSYTGNKLNRTLSKIKHESKKISFLTKSFIGNPKEAFGYQMSVTKQKLGRLIAPKDIVPKNIFTSYEAEIYRKYSDALDAYKLTGAGVKVTLFGVEKRLYFVDDPASLGWSKFAQKGVVNYQVPGDHTTVLYPPNNRKFAVILQQALDRQLQEKN